MHEPPPTRARRPDHERLLVRVRVRIKVRARDRVQVRARNRLKVGFGVEFSPHGERLLLRRLCRVARRGHIRAAGSVCAHECLHLGSGEGEGEGEGEGWG